MKKAAMSVTDVTVIETPACLSVLPILSCRGKSFSSADKLLRDWIITYMSSTPIPRSKRGIPLCNSPKDSPVKKQKPNEAPKDMPITNMPMSAKTTWNDNSFCKIYFFRSHNLSRTICLLFWRISESYHYDMLEINEILMLRLGFSGQNFSKKTYPLFDKIPSSQTEANINEKQGKSSKHHGKVVVKRLIYPILVTSLRKSIQSQP